MQNKILSLIPEYLSLGVVFYDKDGYLKYANNVALNMFSTTMEQVLDINIFDDPNITAEDKAELKKGVNVSFETDYDFDLCGETFFNTGIRGARKYFVTKVAIMRSEAGDVQGYLLTCEDVTEKKEQERKIKSVQKELALALNAGKLTSWNYRLEDSMFYKFDYYIENIEKRSLEFIRKRIHPEERERFETLLNAIIRKEEFLTNSIVLRIKEDGEEDYRYCNFTYCPKEDEAGRVVVITFIQQDITEDIIYQQNLILAKNRAEEADKLKSTFLANMSHEIRTPLNAIVGFSELLSDTDEPSEKNEYKQLIETNSDILLRLIGDILDLSKIEAGSIDIKRQDLDLLQLCNELYLSFQQRIKNPAVTLKLINPYSKCIAEFDKYRFIQIFTNFVTNAIKYTPSGEIVMGYECEPGKVRLYVKDTGIGIPDKKKNRIFSRFEKLDNFAQGTGLGLSICKAIADATNGEVGFESEENVGSEFWYIAYTKVEYTEKTGLEEVEVEEDISEQDFSVFSERLGQLNILVAEDIDSNFQLVKKILKDNDLDRAITGAEALEKARNNSYDLIFMDMRMPVMDGLEATFLIRQFDENIPIIALTANAFDSDKEAAFAVGCNHFMTKPLKKKELMKLLSDFVEERTF
ncbi:hybrid sensor histidine kinase/response regulator [Candidatus Bacteroides intestinigallinarum]|uniref:hybrid sensor histidine kinase/response regulator n=1 Tax=Candidatus Bacteroides intestinigallinarum TaxID=2838470 RepID=UPI00216611A1|nr:PAS domain-containing hybrid sensor histidine kinase/response regulator [Candidatus Bacteroides intestinigallinarum]MCS3202848.1 response regulator [Candidatus Bacteroides intestinigallinarum]